jgi:hypothetical protein
MGTSSTTHTGECTGGNLQRERVAGVYIFLVEFLVWASECMHMRVSKLCVSIC